jgi:hypothetical protein
MASVDNFVIALDDIEEEMRALSIDVDVELSVTRGCIPVDANDGYELTEFFGRRNRYLVGYESRSVRAHWDEGWFDIGGPEFPFVWSMKDSALHQSFPQELIADSEDAELTVWPYLDPHHVPLPESMSHLEPHMCLLRNSLSTSFKGI